METISPLAQDLIMLLNFMLITGGLAVGTLVALWTLNPVRCSDPFWV